MAIVKIDGKEFNTDENNVILDYTEPELMQMEGLTPTRKNTLIIDGIEVETAATIKLIKGDGKQRLTRKSVKVPGAMYY